MMGGAGRGFEYRLAGSSDIRDAAAIHSLRYDTPLEAYHGRGILPTMVTTLHYFRPSLGRASRYVGPLLLLYFVATADLRLIFQTLGAANAWLVLTAVLLALPFFVLKALRWQLILSIWRVHVPLETAVSLVCIGQYAGTVTPGQAGDAVRAWYLRQRGYQLSVGLASVALDRVFDIMVTVFVVGSGLFLYRASLPRPAVSIAIGSAALLLLALLCLAAITNVALRGAVRRQFIRLPGVLRQQFDGLALASIRCTPWQLILITLVSAAALSWTYVRIYLLFLALDIPIPVGACVTFVALLSLVGPMSPGGVGTRDALLIVFLQATLGTHPELALAQALALSALILLLNIVNVAVGFAYSLRYRPIDGDNTPQSP